MGKPAAEGGAEVACAEVRVGDAELGALVFLAGEVVTALGAGEVGPLAVLAVGAALQWRACGAVNHHYYASKVVGYVIAHSSRSDASSVKPCALKCERPG